MSVDPSHALDPGRLARHFYRAEPPLVRFLVWGRPLICPLAPLAAWVRPGARVLDIGCGNGLWLLGLAASGLIRQGIGCDRDPAALAIALRAARIFSEEHTLSKITLDFLQISEILLWPEGPFDTVSIIDVLHHIHPDLQKDFLLSAWEKVDRGGRLIYKDMARTPIMFAAVNRLHDLLVARQWIHYFPIESAIILLEQAGANLLQRQCWRRGPYAHEMLIAERSK